MNIVEFAKRAGCSTATVSRAFHEPQKLHASTRHHILALAEQLQYYPSPSGRALVTGRHDVLGLIWPLEVEGAGALYAQRVLAAITRQLVSNDLDLLICPVDRQNSVTVAHAQRTLLRSRCDAWIMLYPRAEDVLIKALRKSQKPVICLMGRIPECPDWKTVQLNQRTWIEDALLRLREEGAKKVLFYGCRKGEPDHEERLKRFQELAPKHFANRWKVLPVWPPGGGELGALVAKKKFDAVIGVDDAAALAALIICKQLQLDVPGDIQLVGIDDSPAARTISPVLSTYGQPLDAMAAYAVDLALGRCFTSKTFEPILIPGQTMRKSVEPDSTAQRP